MGRRAIGSSGLRRQHTLLASAAFAEARSPGRQRPRCRALCRVRPRIGAPTLVSGCALLWAIRFASHAWTSCSIRPTACSVMLTLAEKRPSACSSYTGALPNPLALQPSGSRRLRLVVVIVGHRQVRSRCHLRNCRENERGAAVVCRHARNQEGAPSGNCFLSARLARDGRSGKSASPVPTSQRHRIATNRSRGRETGASAGTGQ
jgi:hypothetical protein